MKLKLIYFKNCTELCSHCAKILHLNNNNNRSYDKK